ncbi:hypothetical protein CAS74_004806 [Pichia kudriavzevii]|uniref:Myotubularin phosphatase domain-containing protein n=1 Tax=Pichia kudriavzevii TaxID=4909 RepID=A0A1Z8JHL5_PICKU|nr:uncharacterized protein C5L36_0A11550 [Pichia kudriavzevii]AWU74573.1 hypothetical protein C5L36_0A11550 [Pichia kudriavzevii]OUT20070.1 hypothetical protein CAS74_004806 [Pichia kudriavzevii]
MEYMKVTKVEDVTMYRRGKQYEGTLHLTTHHIIFTLSIGTEASAGGGEGKGGGRAPELWFCYPLIERVDFNRGSAKLYEHDNIAYHGNGIDISASSLAATASDFTNTITNGLGLGLGLGLGKVLGGNSGEKNAAEMDELTEKVSEVTVDCGGNKDDDEKRRLIRNKRQKDMETLQRKLCRGACIRIQFRDFNYISFDFKNILRGADVFDTMLRLTCIESIDKLYAFIYRPVKAELEFNSWKDYDLRKEFERQGLEFGKQEGSADGSAERELGRRKWRITQVNKDYQLCESYPRELVVPQSITDTFLGYATKYRSKGRFPALTFYYKKNGCTITRCSQPLVGIKQNRSLQDEKLIHEIFSTNGKDNARNLLVDARPLTNAMAQVALGAGTEVVDNYGENTKKVFLNIENIHVMRESLNKVKGVLKDGDVNQPGQDLLEMEALTRSGWLDHIKALLRATDLLTKYLVFDGVHLVVHCSDGWDRTAQVCSLVELCVDPYYRTLEGFIVLIEKEWISFGHQFNERCGHLQRESKFYNNTEEGNFQRLRNLNQRFRHQQNMKFESPVFVQFLHCVYELIEQHEYKFEFNERFLRRLVYHLYSCQYGTFLVDCEADRGSLSLERRTRSVWDYFKSRRGEFVNGSYERYEDVLDVDWSRVGWWKGLFAL